jgi:hypothetical protein
MDSRSQLRAEADVFDRSMQRGLTASPTRNSLETGVSSARCRMSDGLTVAAHQFEFPSQTSEKYFDAQQKSYRAMPPLRVVVSYDHTHAVKKQYVRAGGN